MSIDGRHGADRKKLPTIRTDTQKHAPKLHRIKNFHHSLLIAGTKPHRNFPERITKLYFEMIFNNNILLRQTCFNKIYCFFLSKET